ncbi:MAG: biopolymer transporter ExbB [Gammaproteobacteria bacterium]|nr:MAG: biopolymer transporter ExbB [Gammaproteobacteria bacterium]
MVLGLASGQGIITKLLAYFNSGGPVMYPLVLVSVLMWMLIFERMVTFHGLEFGDLGMAGLLRWYREQENHEKHNGLRWQIGLFLQRNRSHDRELNNSLLDECYLKIKPGIDRNIAAITILAMISPLLGLLGTVTGMMMTFDVISLFGTGNARALAGGISEALVTTQTGLLVSIPGVFASVLLSMRSRRLIVKLEESLTNLKRIV